MAKEPDDELTYDLSAGESSDGETLSEETPGAASLDDDVSDDSPPGDDLADAGTESVDDEVEDDFGSLDLAELEQGSEKVQKTGPGYEQYSGSGGRVVARDEYVKGKALGESELESRLLKGLVIAIALAIPALTIYYQMRPDDAGAEREDAVEAEAE